MAVVMSILKGIPLSYTSRLNLITSPPSRDELDSEVGESHHVVLRNILKRGGNLILIYSFELKTHEGMEQGPYHVVFVLRVT